CGVIQYGRNNPFFNTTGLLQTPQELSLIDKTRNQLCYKLSDHRLHRSITRGRCNWSRCLPWIVTVSLATVAATGDPSSIPVRRERDDSGRGRPGYRFRPEWWYARYQTECAGHPRSARGRRHHRPPRLSRGGQ